MFAGAALVTGLGVIAYMFDHSPAHKSLLAWFEWILLASLFIIPPPLVILIPATRTVAAAATALMTAGLLVLRSWNSNATEWDLGQYLILAYVIAMAGCAVLSFASLYNKD